MPFNFASVLATALLVLEVTAVPNPPMAAKSGRALYLISNSKMNSVVSMKINANGMLSKGSSTSTGGSGSNAIDEAAQKPAVPDALVSQSALTVAGNFVFAVNAGSNTVSMLTICKTDPTKLTMVGKAVAVPGEFPNTVSASLKNKLVCVGSSGAVAGVSCASFSEKGISSMDTLRPFMLNQTTPPMGPLNTVSQVFFSEDQQTLYATVKGDPRVQNTGFLASFPVGKSTCGGAMMSVSQMGVKSSPAGTAVLFGSSTIPGSTDIFVTDASFGGAVLSINAATNVATVKGKGTIADQKATCWVAVSAATKTAYVTDVAANRIVEMSLTDASIKRMFDLSANGDPGLIDLRVAGNFIYALSPGNGTTKSAVTVVNAMTGKQVQHFVSSGSFDKNAMGMAVFA